MLDLYDHWGLGDDPASVEMIQRRYIERLVGCIENLCNPACTLPTDEKRAQVQAMLDNPRVPRALELAQPRTAMMRAMLWPIRRRDVGLILAEGGFISFVKRNNTRLFATLKANR